MGRFSLVLWLPLVLLPFLPPPRPAQGASTASPKRVLVGFQLEAGDSEKLEAIEEDTSDDNSAGSSEEEEDPSSSPPPASTPATGMDRLSFLSGAAARVAKVWHAAASGKRLGSLPRFRDHMRAHKPAKAARVVAHDHQDHNVYVVDDTMAAGVHPGDEDDPMGQQGQTHHGDTDGYLEAGIEPDLELLYVRHRLQKLDFYFEFLKVMSEDCRQRMLCEVSKEPSRFYPLSSVLEDATSFSGNYHYVTSHLINTTEGARLLSYIEASYRGQDRARSCAVFQYRCPAPTEDMINYDALCLWREMVRWLTIHIVAPNN